MPYETDIEIARETPMRPLREAAEGLGIDEKYLELYGKYKAKIDWRAGSKPWNIPRPLSMAVPLPILPTAVTP
jgi:formyltetrahydrofolate synthetase